MHNKLYYFSKYIIYVNLWYDIVESTEYTVTEKVVNFIVK